MNTKEAVAIAKSYLKEVYEEEEASEFLLEEVEMDSDAQMWIITISFLRRQTSDRVIQGIKISSGLKRTYKVVKIDYLGQAISIKDWAHYEPAE